MQNRKLVAEWCFEKGAADNVIEKKVRDGKTYFVVNDYGKLRALFAELGFGRTVVTTPEHHDEMIAYTSQLCHIISSAYLREPLALEHAGFSAGSFRDLTRVGAPAPALWSELFASNSEALLPVLDRLIARLVDFRDAIAADDRPALVRQLAEGQEFKRRLSMPSNP